MPDTPNQIYDLWEKVNQDLYAKMIANEIDFRSYTKQCHENQIRYSSEIKKLIDHSEEKK